VRLYTSSYRAYRSEMGQAMITSLGLPRFRLAEARQWPRCWLITPTSALFHASDEEFDREYPARLALFGPAKIAQTLEQIARDHQAETLILLCFEADAAQCHRSMFADYWLVTTGEAITEIT
jgi:Protein of unknown function, DUF488